MIKSKKEYKFYLNADRVALGKITERPKLFSDVIWKFQRLLRKVEYYKNVKTSLFFKPYYLFLFIKYKKLSCKLGFLIPVNVFGPGLSIAHPGTIVVNKNAKIGANCRIHTCVNIGNSPGSNGISPIIGNNTYISPGAKIYGPINIADGIAIGANSVVNKSFNDPHITIAGVPAKKISDNSARNLRRQTNEKIDKLFRAS